MVTGALKKNKRNRNQGYDLASKVKILSGDEITFEKIKSKIDTGCLVVLEGVEKSKVFAYEVSSKTGKDKSVYVALKSGNPEYISLAILKFVSIKLPRSYYVYSGTSIPLNKQYPSFYNELNKKIEKIL